MTIAKPDRAAAGATPAGKASEKQERKPKLLEQVRLRLRAMHYSRRTESAYVQWIRRFILFHGKRHPSELGEEEINAFLTHLAVKGKVSA